MTIAIILAGGSGSRFGDEIPKQFIILHGRRILDYSIKTFESHSEINEIIIVTSQNWLGQIQSEYPNYKVIEGGNTRRDSSYNGLLACPENTDQVLIHDAARPFIDHTIINNCMNALKTEDAVDTVIPATDTIVEVKNKLIMDMPNRDYMFQGQTPQAFKFNIIKKAHNEISGETTDDIRLTKQLGIDCFTVPGSEYNFKITTQQDIYLAERISQIQNKLIESDQNFINKKILIFGGTGGIGSAIGDLLIGFGANVTKLGSEIQLKNRELPKRFFDKNWDIIIHSAGLFIRKPFDKSNIDEWDDIMSINLRSAYLIGQLAQKTMRDNGWLVFIGSSSSNRGRKEQSIYAASKAALNNLTQSLSEEFKHLGIRVNCINPPRTDTPMRDKAFPGENKSLLASPHKVAEDIILYCQGEATGHIVNLKYHTQARANR